MKICNIGKKCASVCAAILVLSIFLTGCGSKIPAGYYQLKSVTEGDTKVKSKDLDDYGLENSCFVVDGRNEAVFVFMFSTFDAKINSGKGVIETDFGDVAYSVDGDEVTMQDENITMVFEKSQ